MNIFVLDHVREAVRAEQVDIARLDRILLDLDLYRGLHAECADVVAIRGPLRLFRGIEAPVHEFLQ